MAAHIIDDTFEKKDFIIENRDGAEEIVKSPEEIQYPSLFGGLGNAPAGASPEDDDLQEDQPDEVVEDETEKASAKSGGTSPKTGHRVVPENVKGYSYKLLFGPYLKGAGEITIRDPYVRQFWQIRNCLELIQLINSMTPEGEEVKVHLVTQSDPDYCEKQDENLMQVQQSCEGSGVAFTFEYENSPNFHARSIATDTGWKITIDRGLDIFQKTDLSTLSLTGLSQEDRLTKGCEISYIREE